MEPKQVSLVYFSPTNTTKTILEEIAKGMGKEVTHVIDLTKPESRSNSSYELNDTLLLVGAPVYAGRLPEDFVETFKKFKGSGNPAVLTVLYGNRAFDDALLELKDIASECGFVPMAASAFIGEHSWASKEFPIAVDRPDASDLEKAFLFGKQIADFFGNTTEGAQIKPVEVPGNFPYRDGMGAGKFSFITVTDDCDECGVCIDVCPKEAIDESDNYATLPESCIFCCACIKSCPQGARVLSDADTPVKEKAKMLYENFQARKEPETFFSE